MKLFSFFLVVSILMVAWVPSCLADPSRMAWIDPRDSAKNPLNHEDFHRFRSVGINTLVFPALSEGRVHFQSNLLPSRLSRTNLVEQIELSREEGFEIGLYFQVFIQGGPPTDPSHLARLHPEWLSYNESGRAMKDVFGSGKARVPFLDGFFLDPGIPRVSEFMIAILTESLGKMSPDWILLDQVRYPFPEPAFEGTSATEQPYGYHPIPRGNFKKLNGIDPLLLRTREVSAGTPEGATAGAEDLQIEWDRNRRDFVDDFVEGVHNLLVVQYPRVRFGTVGYPDPFFASKVLFQDWASWIDRGWVETVFLPNHHSPLDSRIDLGILRSSLQEKVGYAGSLPLGTSVAEFLAGLPVPLGEQSWIFFADRPNGYPTDQRPTAPVDLSSESLRETLLVAKSDNPIAVPSTDSVAAPPPPPESYTAEIRALYGFNPEKLPFLHLSPEGVAEKLLDLGFNAVFGGSGSEEIREALKAANIRRFGEYPVFVGKSYWSQDPSSRPVTAEGTPFKQQSWYAPLDPHQPWLREIKREALLKRVRDEELDGIWLDFIRFPVFWEEVPPKLIETSFSSAAITSFQETTGIVPEGSTIREMAAWILQNADEEWRRFRADTILRFAREVEEDLNEQSPDVLLGAFVLPWTENEYGNAIYRIAGQDLEGFVGVVDVLSPMVYSHQLGRPPEWIRERTWQVSQMSPLPVYPIVQCFDEPTPMSPQEVEDSIRNGMLNPSGGVILFSQRHLESTGRWELVRRVLNEKHPTTTPPATLSTP